MDGRWFPGLYLTVMWNVKINDKCFQTILYCFPGHQQYLEALPDNEISLFKFQKFYCDLFRGVGTLSGEATLPITFSLASQ